MYEAISEREQRVLCSIDSVVFASAAQRSRVLAGHPGMAEISSVVIPQFVAVPESTGNQDPQHDAVTVGRLEPRKNHSFLVDVIAAARTQGHEYSLTIIGEGPERSAIQGQIERLDLEGQVTLAGRVEHDIGLELEKHRIYLHASPQESFGLAAVEAMALGIPTITADTGVVELLEKGVDTIVWNDLTDPAEGARQLIEIMSDPARLADLGRRGKERFDKTLTIPAVAPQLADHLTEAANRPV
jgi:glycosyltransferase involved in cell wall biosynthesis